MAISNISSNLRPGVCTSTTRPSTPYEGQVIYETDTNRVLVWDNAAWVMIVDTDEPPGLQLIKSQLIGSAVSSVPVNNVFSSDYDVYKVIISGVDCSSAGGVGMRFQFGSTTTGYYGSQLYDLYSGVANGYNRSTNAAFALCGMLDTDMFGTQFDVFNPFQNLKSFISGMNLGAGYFSISQYFVDNELSYTGFTITPGAGTITGGYVRVYGYRK